MMWDIFCLYGDATTDCSTLKKKRSERLIEPKNAKSTTLNGSLNYWSIYRLTPVLASQTIRLKFRILFRLVSWSRIDWSSWDKIMPFFLLADYSSYLFLSFENEYTVIIFHLHRKERNDRRVKTTSSKSFGYECARSSVNRSSTVFRLVSFTHVSNNTMPVFNYRFFIF